MINKINRQIENINASLQWIKAHKPEHYAQRFPQLVQQRCQLRRMAAAEEEFPAIAAYGESQRGKSYVMSNVLQKDGKPFTITANGRKINFIERINPPTVNTEATGVVTRFTSFLKNPGLYNAQYPVLMKVLSVTDVVAILTDGYFNDIHDYQTLDTDEIKALTQQINATYATRPEVQSAIIEDDILDLQHYLRKYIGAKSVNLWKSAYLPTVAQVVRRVPVGEWKVLFAPLWFNDASLTALFERFVQVLQRIDFAAKVYLPIEAVLNNDNTIMGVECLKGLICNGTGCTQTTDAYVPTATGALNAVCGLNKAMVSAICREVVFKVDEEFLESTEHYDFTMMEPEVRAKLPQGEIHKDILKHNDLIDFPGARARLSLKADDIANNFDQVVKRGKVAFLFNKYSEDFAINILLYCHDNCNLGATEIPHVLADWVNEYVGATPESRARHIQEMGGSPFFFIATKFNIDMAVKTNASLNDEGMLAKRWTDRFMKIAHDECFVAQSNPWFYNWDQPGNSFKNTYLLRDFKYSTNSGDGSSLYAGFTPEGGKENQCLLNDVVIDGRHVDLYASLRRSFVNCDIIRRFFADPALAWDTSATMNNDGSLLLLQRLTAVAPQMAKGRDMLFGEKLQDACKQIRALMQDYYHSDDAEVIFEENLRKGFRICREIDFTCNEDNYFFGHLIERLQITEKKVYQCLHSLINSNAIVSQTHDFHNYEIILKTCGKQLAACTNDEQRWKVLIQCYGFYDRKEAEDYLVSRNVDPTVLFQPNPKKKTNANTLADAVFDLWCERITSAEMVRELTDDNGFNAMVMGLLLDNVVSTARQLLLPERMDQLIAPYVNVVNLGTANVSFLADLLASTINNYVVDLGFHLRSKEEIDSIRATAEKRSLPLFNYLDAPRKEDFSEQELGQLFCDLGENAQTITPAVEQGIFEWKECVLLSFVAATPKIDYDPQANNELKEILCAV